MDICRELEQKYDLIPAVKGQQQDGGAQARIVDYPRGNVKQQVSSAVRYALQNYRFASAGELNTLLKLFNVSAEQVEGTVRGNPYSGVVYQAMKDGEPAGKPFKSSLIGKDVGFKVLQEKHAECKEFLKTKPANVERLKRIVGDAMQRAADPNELARLLGEEKVNLVMHRAKDGRIHGVTFIDHQGKLAVNGSRLGKAFSAARFEELYGNLKDLQVENPEADISQNTEKEERRDANTVSNAVVGIDPESNTIPEILEYPTLLNTGDDLHDNESGIIPVTAHSGSPDDKPTTDGYSWPDENTIWDDYDYGFFYPPPDDRWSLPFEEYVPDLSDPFTALLEGAGAEEPFEEQPKRPKRKRKNRYKQ